MVQKWEGARVCGEGLREDGEGQWDWDRCDGLSPLWCWFG